MEDSEKILKAKDLKETGNEHYKAGNLKQALKSYHHALLNLHEKDTSFKQMLLGEAAGGSDAKPNPVKDDELNSRRKALKLECHNNISACLIKEKRWERALPSTEKALAVDSTNAKALFRNGQVLYELGNIDAAAETFHKMNKLYPRDKSADSYLKLIEAKDKQYAAKEKKLYEKMIGGKS